MKKTIATIALTILACQAMPAQTTLRKNLRPTTEKTDGTPTASVDSDGVSVIEKPSSAIASINGYDKPLRSRRETFFLSNNSSNGTITSITITLTYTDSAGRMLHKATKTLNCDVPPAETRQLNMPSWDVQQNFYYTRSTVPTRVEQATPYDVAIDIDTITLTKNR